MIERSLAAHITSSDETIFGQVFFEPICRALCGKRTAGVKGVDFVIETETIYEAIALKSGTNIFNSDASYKQAERFKEHERSLRATAGFDKRFVAIMGCAYGRANSDPTAAREFYKLAGQAFWEKITGSSDFYLQFINLMRDDPEKHAARFRAAHATAMTRLKDEFLKLFCDSSGNILWEQLVAFNSSRGKSKKRL